MGGACVGYVLGAGVGDGGLMNIDGNGTTIHNNCTSENISCYGWDTYLRFLLFHSSCIILTIQTIFKNNGGGGNYVAKVHN